MQLHELIAVLIQTVLAALLLGLPALPAVRQRSWRLFLLGVPKMSAGVYLPLGVFVFSAALAPEWKGAAKLGWLGCFCVGKLVLTPLVLWATASFYALEVFQVANRLRPWIVLGYFQGAVVAGVCLLSGIEWLLKPYDGIEWWLAVPAYVTAYFTLRTIQLVRETNTAPWTLLKAWLAGIPLWAGAFYYSWKTFSQLPDEPPKGCFVVTAAARGHIQLVGPFVPYQRHGRARSVNHQLLTFWAFEERWQATAPRTHRAFRRLYNVVGPRLARRLANPWFADAAYLALKPCEWIAARLLPEASPNPPK
ncbi:MAG: hypothetical protein CK546_01940 [Pedosphaera sp.]|nr:hypothetical protein [Pedosphaera sp.]PHX95578.1 MAG: hypothetical protein CK546_01940 [Pedosphaera sp.]